MKTTDMSKTTAIAVAILSLGMYAMAQKAGGPAAGAGRAGAPGGMQNQPTSMQQQNQTMPSQQNHMNAPNTPAPIGSPSPGTKTGVKTSPTPRGHHYGWQKGRHNPHRSPSPSPSASASATASPSATASASASASPSPTSSR